MKLKSIFFLGWNESLEIEPRRSLVVKTKMFFIKYGNIEFSVWVCIRGCVCVCLSVSASVWLCVYRGWIKFSILPNNRTHCEGRGQVSPENYNKSSWAYKGHVHLNSPVTSQSSSTPTRTSDENIISKFLKNPEISSLKKLQKDASCREMDDGKFEVNPLIFFVYF